MKLSSKRSCFFYRQLFFLLLLVLASLSCKAAQSRWQAGVTPSVQPSSTVAPGSLPAVTRTAEPVVPLPVLTNSPSAPPLPTVPLPSPTVPFTPDPAATARQLQAFEELWNVVNAEYLYPDFNGLDWQAIHEEYAQRIQAGLSDEAFYDAMGQMIDRLGDEHSTYFSPEQAKAEDAEYASDYNYVGIGVYTSVVQEKRSLAIVLIFPNSPAEVAGLKMHDSILAVDGQPVVDEEGRRLNVLRGPEGTTVELTVQSPGGLPRQVQVRRQRIAGPLPVPYYVLTSPAGKRIGYVLVPTFNDSTVDDQVGQALLDMTSAGSLDGLIIDNRENGGGPSEVLLNTLAYFIQGPVGSFLERQNKTVLRVNAHDINGSRRVPLVVLVGNNTASFGEIFAGILQDLGRARIIGEQTMGNVEVLSIYNFSDGSRAWIATSTFRPLNHPDQNWENIGITPDQVVRSRWDEVTLETDPVILIALQYFDTLVGLP